MTESTIGYLGNGCNDMQFSSTGQALKCPKCKLFIDSCTWCLDICCNCGADY